MEPQHSISVIRSMSLWLVGLTVIAQVCSYLGSGYLLKEHLVRRATDLTPVRHTMDNLYSGLALVRKRGWVRPVLGAGMNIGFDMLTLYLLFTAAGHTINPGVLMAGYGLAFLLGKVAFLFPGGVGVIESGMVAIYTNLGIPAST